MTFEKKFAEFKKELEKRNIEIHHIDNMLLHSGLENNAAFLEKTEQALATLTEIKEKVGNTTLLKTVDRLKTLHLTGLFMKYWERNKEHLRKNLLGCNPSLLKFKIYKLGYFISLSQQ